MLQISIVARLEAAYAAFSRLERVQAPHAARWAVNALTADVAQATRNVLAGGRFRASPQGRAWMTRHVKVLGPNSTLGRQYIPPGRDGPLSGFVAVIPPESKGQSAGWSRYRGSLVAMMEEGGVTPGPRPFGGLVGFGNYAVPVRRPGDRTPIPMRMYPINLGLQSRQSIEGGLTAGALRGKQKTYLVRTGVNEGMLFQRFGRARDDTMPLFNTRAQTRVPARRFFFSTAERIIETRFEMHLERAMQQALWGRGAYRG